MIKSKFWNIVNEVITNSDVVLEILDARLIDDTRNVDIENKIKELNKKLIHVVNKIDLVDIRTIKEKLKELTNPVFISSIKRLGTTILKQKILQIGRKDRIVVGVVGYPNTGKSSVINILSGRKKAKTSSVSGTTKGIQKIRSSARLIFLDTPGVIPFEDKDIVKLTLIGSINVQSLKEPDLIARHLIEKLNGRVEQHYNVEMGSDSEKTLERIALKINRLKKGGIPDIMQTAKIILMDWQRGKIK